MGETIRFILDNQVSEVTKIDPAMTVLEYLRGPAGRCGTKEGCAEGDCGACTVVLGELNPDATGMRYRAVNACILFMPTLDGKELITVESLRAPDGTLDPAQRAMVEQHGSQCGFCTPGFVMSIYALAKTESTPTRARINDVLAGNLCRCTGYRPIIDAAAQACAERRPDPAPPANLALLQTIQPHETLVLDAAGTRFFAPTTLDALASLRLDYPDAPLLGGGTDMGLWVTKLHQRLPVILSIGQVKALTAITTTGTHIEIGAGATYTEAQAVLSAHYPDFGELIRRIGSVQIRNSGTIGGNIGNGSPIGDTPPALIALDASLILRRGAERREIPVEDFFLAYRRTALASGEFIEQIRIPLPQPDQHFRAYKISKRFDQDISAVCGGFSVDLVHNRVRAIRLAYGGMAGTPKRARAVEAALLGQEWSADSIRAALPNLDRDFQPLSDMRASSAYRQRIAGNLLLKFQLETSDQPAATRLLEAFL